MSIKLGFACVWDKEPRRTWSYTPWDLRDALRRRPDVDVLDVGFQVPTALRRALQVASLRRQHGRWIAPWEHARIWEWGLERELERRAKALKCDVVLQIQDLGAISTPFMVYQDFSYDVISACLKDGSLGLREYFPHLNARTVARRRVRQLRIYRQAARLLTMSHFLRQSLIDETGIEADRVVTLPPGISASRREDVDASDRPRDSTDRLRKGRLLFVGTTFLVKGGDLVLEALRILRDRFPGIRLTVAGPAEWPVAGSVPEGVDFLGRVDPRELPGIYRKHDLLVVPSRLEGFGKVFVEALAHGLPCIGRRAFAMPELIQPGVTGDLVEQDNAVDLALRIESVLRSEDIYRHCEQSRREVVARFNWDRAAADVVGVASSILSGRCSAFSRESVA